MSWHPELRQSGTELKDCAGLESLATSLFTGLVFTDVRIVSELCSLKPETAQDCVSSTGWCLNKSKMGGWVGG